MAKKVLTKRIFSQSNDQFTTSEIYECIRKRKKKLIAKDKFHRSQHCEFYNNVGIIKNNKPGIGGEMLPGQNVKPQNTVYHCGEGAGKPAWLAFDKQVLCFDAYCKEGVDNKREERVLVRKCKIYFYLEDDSIQIVEPRNANDAYAQGTILKRHRIPLPPPNDDSFYTLENFNVGKEVPFYGRVYKIVDCDQFTKEFLIKFGLRVPSPIPWPECSYQEFREAVYENSRNPLRPYTVKKGESLHKFLEFDRQILRFYCYWDDTANGGDMHRMTLRYFLNDDTIEIVSVLQPNSGYDSATVFLHRSKLPKTVIPCAMPGENSNDATILNLFGNMYNQYNILDNLQNPREKIDYYTDADLKIGTEINVWGRKFMIYDCDEYTQYFYANKYGLNEAELKSIPVPSKEKFTKVQQFIPPYNGFGSEEDSLGFCLSVIPKPPTKDMTKYFDKDGDVLRFTAELDSTDPASKNRHFIISYYPSDDTFIVFEPHLKNSGFTGGKFLDRSRIKKPGQPRFSSKPSDYYTATDLYVGAVIDVHCHKFTLKEADECTLCYMECNPAEFPYADNKRVLEKLKSVVNDKDDEMKRFVYKGDTGNNGLISFNHFRKLISMLVGDKITEHEMITLGRTYQHKEESSSLSKNTLLAMLQEDLKKRNFDGFKDLECAFFHHDKELTGYLDLNKIERTCKAIRLPVNGEMLKLLLAKLELNKNQETNYKDFIKLLNWKVNPIVVDHLLPEKPFVTKFSEAPQKIKMVEYRPFLEDLLGSWEL